MASRLARALSIAHLVPALLAAQAAIKDLPISHAERQRFVGAYAVSPGPDKPAMTFRVFERGDTLMGQLRTNEPTRLIYQGENAFRPSAARDFSIEFGVAGGVATTVAIVSKNGTMSGARTSDVSVPPADPATSGALFAELARMDSLLFDATYVTCDVPRITALFADDIEFYHDKTGLHKGAQVRADFERLAGHCPRDQGITRVLVPGTLHVYPINEFGAVQTGVHWFVQKGAPTATVAQFVHVWQKKDGAWKITRELSFDHRITDAP